MRSNLKWWKIFNLPAGRRAIKWKNRRAQYSCIDWRRREKTEREKKTTLNVFYFMIISFIYGLFLLLLFCHTENFIFFLLLFYSSTELCFGNKKKTEWINENKNKQQRQLRERWVVVIFLVKCSRVWGAKNGNIKRHNKTRKKCFKHIRLVFIAWIC